MNCPHLESDVKDLMRLSLEHKIESLKRKLTKKLELLFRLNTNDISTNEVYEYILQEIKKVEKKFELKCQCNYNVDNSKDSTIPSQAMSLQTDKDECKLPDVGSKKRINFTTVEQDVFPDFSHVLGNMIRPEDYQNTTNQKSNANRNKKEMFSEVNSGGCSSGRKRLSNSFSKLEVIEENAPFSAACPSSKPRFQIEAENSANTNITHHNECSHIKERTTLNKNNCLRGGFESRFCHHVCQKCGLSIKSPNKISSSLSMNQLEPNAQNLNSTSSNSISEKTRPATQCQHQENYKKHSETSYVSAPKTCSNCTNMCNHQCEHHWSGGKGFYPHQNSAVNNPFHCQQECEFLKLKNNYFWFLHKNKNNG